MVGCVGEGCRRQSCSMYKECCGEGEGDEEMLYSGARGLKEGGEYQTFGI